MATLFVSTTGCRNSDPTQSEQAPQTPRPAANPLSSSRPNQNVAPAGDSPSAEGTGASSQPHSPAATQENGEAISPAQTEPVQRVLDRMESAYRNARTYRDKGEICISWTQGGQKWERKTPYSTCLERPNRIQIQVNETVLNADGKEFCAYFPEMGSAILTRKCPDTISLRDILCERDLYLKLIDAESNRFSYLPPPLVLLFAKKPLDTFLYGVDEGTISMRNPQKYEDHDCFLISIMRNEDETILWIDKESYVLRKVELPTRILKKEKSAGGTPVESMSMTIELHDAEINCEKWESSVAVTLPADVREVETFAPVQMELLGKTFPSTPLANAEGTPVSIPQLRGKTLVLFFATAWDESAHASLARIETLYQKYKTNPKMLFLAILPTQKSAESVARAGVTLPFVIDSNGVLAQQCRVVGNVAFLVDERGVIQSSTDCDRNFEASVGKTLNGVDVATEMIRADAKSRQDYEESILKWIENDVFLDPADITQPQIPEAKVSPSSDPVVFKNAELWKNSELKAPGTILVVPGVEEGAPEKILVLENGNTIAELDEKGSIVARHPLPLDPNIYEISLLSAINPEDGKRYYATFGKRIHIFDENFELVSFYPPKKPEELSDSVSDVRLEDLDGDGRLEVYSCFLNNDGIHKTSLQGELLVQNKELGLVFQMASIRLQNENTLAIVNQTGGILLIDPTDLSQISQFSVLERTLGWITSSNFQSGALESLAGIALAVGGKNKALGIDHSGNEIWSLNLPDGIYTRPIDKIFPVSLRQSEERSGEWLILGPDSSLHLVEINGILIDQFNYGKIITGISSARLGGRGALLISTPDDVRAVEIQWKK
ncbi:MAG: redoxin domain-containing protein [Planctomycetia bacterium]|nr:redoxin domain-containing protein [Planctomycetia bacterium]